LPLKAIFFINYIVYIEISEKIFLSNLSKEKK
jgi:hypothetical protein